MGPYPLLPFGYGLSYTTFKYGKVELSTNRWPPGQTLTIRALETNTGDFATHEVVQFYVRDLVGSLTRPVGELKGFRRVRLNPGERRTVEFALSTDDLAFYNNQEQPVLEPGQFKLYLGGRSVVPLADAFELQE